MPKIPEQGQEINFDGLTGHLNAFSQEEMLTIYVATDYFRGVCVDMMKEFPALKRLNNLEREEYESNKKMINHADAVLSKLDKTFNQIGVDMREFVRGK